MNQPPSPISMLLSRHTRRREFVAGLAGAAAWPLVASAQQQIPVTGFLSIASAAQSVDLVAAFRKGLSEVGVVEGRSTAIEYRWAEGQRDRLPALMADLMARRVAVLAVDGVVT